MKKNTARANFKLFLCFSNSGRWGKNKKDDKSAVAQKTEKRLLGKNSSCAKPVAF